MMPYTDQQIETLKATDPAIVKQAFAKMSETDRAELFAAVEDYNKRTAAPRAEGGLSRMDEATKNLPAPPAEKPRGGGLIERIAYSTPVQAVTDVPYAFAQTALMGPDRIGGIPLTGIEAIMPGSREKLRQIVQNQINQREARYKALPENQNLLGDLNRGIISTATGGKALPAMNAPGSSMMAQGAAGAMSQPVTGAVGDVAKGKLMQGAVGAGTAGLIKGVAKAPGIIKTATRAGENFDPEAVVARFYRGLKGKASDVVKQDLSSQYGAARAEVREAFNKLRADAGDAPVDLPSYGKTLDDVLAKEGASRGGSDDATVAAVGKLKKALEEADDKSFGSSIDIGARLNEIWGEADAAGNDHLKGVVRKLKTSLQDDLDAFGSQFGDRYKDAKRLYQEKVVPWEDPEEGGKLLQTFLRNPTPDQAMDALLKAKSSDKLNIFISKLSKDKGIPALQAGLVENVYRQSLDDTGTKVIPAKFIGALKSRMDAYNLAFEGSAKWRMDGLTQLMRDSRFISRFYSGEQLGKALPGNRIIGGSRHSTPDGGDILIEMLTKPGVSKWLVKASDAKPGSPEMARIIREIGTKLGAAAGGAKGKEPVETESEE